MAHATEAAQFLQDLAINCQVLACVHLLCDFQVLACLPPKEAVACEDVAQIVGMPEMQLSAVVRMTASVGFLSITRPGAIAHSPLSLQFAANVGMLDAFTFLADTLAPCALRMPEASRHEGCPSPYSLVFGNTSDYSTEVQHRWRLQRQAIAHSRLAMGNEADHDAETGELLAKLDWGILGAATVIDIEGPSINLAVSLALDHTALSVILQRTGASTEAIPAHLGSRVKVQERLPGEQPVRDASVYIVHLASPSLIQPERNIMLDAIGLQLAIHLPLLRRDPLARIVLLARVLPEIAVPSTVNGDEGGGDSKGRLSPQCIALYRNLVLYQLTRGRDHERADVLACVRRTADSEGFLVVTNEIYSKDRSGMMAFEIQYLASPTPSLGSTKNGGDIWHIG